jgi:hypothetical protein
MRSLTTKVMPAGRGSLLYTLGAKWYKIDMTVMLRWVHTETPTKNMEEEG